MNTTRPAAKLGLIDRLSLSIGPQDGATHEEWAALVFVDAGRIETAIRQHRDGFLSAVAKGWLVRGGPCGYQKSATAPREVA
jgi:hypothetical protein